jgi:predicted aldo/keto reductase-like oxidoreductase
MDGSTDGTQLGTIEEKKQFWVTIIVISYINSKKINKKEQTKIREDVSKGFDVTLKKKRFDLIDYYVT